MRSCTAILLVILFLAAALAAPALAQTAPATREARNDWQISVVTFGPGPVIFERYGHVAIRLKNDVRKVDVCYDWGNFSFDDPNFFGRFFKGDMRYWMEAKDSASMLRFYSENADRTVVEQVLNLTPAQSQRLVNIIAAQDNDQDRHYLYDYFKDNCATRVRDVVDEATGNVLRERTKSDFTRHSYRWQNRRLVPVGAVNTVLATLMDFAFGPRNDPPLSRWDASFLPGVLAGELDVTQISDGNGGVMPLVRERRLLKRTTAPANAEPVHAFNPGYLTLPVGLLCGVFLVALPTYSALAFKIAATLWELFALLGTLFMSALILFTRHWVIAWNENLLQFTPLALVVILALWSRRLRARLRWAATAALGLSLLGILVTILPLTPQAR